MHTYARLRGKLDQMDGEWEVTARHWSDGDPQKAQRRAFLIEQPLLDRVELYERITTSDGQVSGHPVGFFDADGLTLLVPSAECTWAGDLELVQRIAR